MDRTDQTERFVGELTACQERVYAYIAAIVGDLNLADDLFQQTCLVLWRKIEEYEPGTSFYSWACRVALYEVMDDRKRRARDRLVLNDDITLLVAPQIEEAALEVDDRRRALRLCLKELTPRHGAIIARRYEPGVSVQMLAAESGQSMRAAYQMLFRIRKLLSDCVQARLVKRSGEA